VDEVAERMLSLAAGTVLDVEPADAVDVAAAAGWDAVGLWFDPDTWTPARTAAVGRRLQATGITALDVEPVILGRGGDPGAVLVDVAAELGAHHVLVASGPAERGEVVDRVGELCARAAGSDVVVVLEFLPIFSIGTLAAAVEVVEEVGHANGAVLVDTLHLARSGGSPADLGAVRRLLPYLQLADAPAQPTASLREEALHGRLLPGEGALPLRAVLDQVPRVPVSVELRSQPLLDAHPDPVDRARVVLSATRKVLGSPPSPT
jgi:sugar phosphate isomerase/epimerase